MEKKRKIYYYIVMDWKTNKPIFESATLPIYYSLRTARKVRDNWSESYLVRITADQLIGLIKTFSVAVK